MIWKPHNYFRYFPLSPEQLGWGLGLTACGYTICPPGAPYPLSEHPEDHKLDWSRGRILDALQIVLITGGGGLFETRTTGQVQIEAGMAFLLLPGQWHRYRPQDETGWVESWLELRGPMMDSLMAGGQLKPGEVVIPSALESGLDQTLSEIHQMIHEGGEPFMPEMATCGMRALTQCLKAVRMRQELTVVEKAVHRALREFQLHYAEPLNIEEMTTSWGIAYSHFRRSFRKMTGFSPWQYVLHLRLAHARRFLAGGAKLEVASGLVGFSSAFHLSTAFKKVYGVSPDAWRRSLGTMHEG